MLYLNNIKLFSNISNTKVAYEGVVNMKPFNKRKASKVTYKTHRKHKASAKEEERKVPENIPGIKPEDVINNNK